MEFLVGETVTIKGKTRDLETYNPTTPDSVTVTIKSTTVVVDGAAMTPLGPGEYVYYYTASTPGYYTYTITATIGVLVSKNRGSFKVVG